MYEVCVLIQFCVRINHLWDRSSLETRSPFLVNVKDAGDGTLEISITGPSGQSISNNIATLGPGHFLVSYVPLENGIHSANITFNAENVNGGCDLEFFGFLWLIYYK